MKKTPVMGNTKTDIPGKGISVMGVFKTDIPGKGIPRMDFSRVGISIKSFSRKNGAAWTAAVSGLQQFI